MSSRRLAACLTALTFAACGSDPAPAAKPDAATATDTAGDAAADSAQAALTYAFPKGFLWGTATAGFQVDMGCPTLPAAECEDPNSDWYQWVTDPDLVSDKGTYNSGDKPSKGPGFWELWAEDLDRAKNELHNNAFRYSLEWSRLFPDKAASSAKTVEDLKKLANPKAVAKYHQIFQGAKARGIQVLLTLNHYSLPLWLHDAEACHDDLDTCKDKGWADKPRMLQAIALYSAYCAAEFGGDIDLWGTLNEPFAVVVAGYLLPSKERTNPPGVFLKIDTAVEVAFTMMEAHAKMYDAVHAQDKVDADGDGKAARVGIVSNLAAVRPADLGSDADKKAAEHCHYVYNQAFLDATIKGQLDRDLDGVAEEQRPDMVGRMDFIGINYYTQLKLKAQAIPGADKYKFLDFQPDTNLFSNYPEGLYEVVTWAKQYGLPMIITENGSADAKDKTLDSYLKPHLQQLHKAIAEDAPVQGYFYWSLMDNFEWNHGMDAYKMGMFHLDTTTKQRTSSPLSQGYGKIAQQNGF